MEFSRRYLLAGLVLVLAGWWATRLDTPRAAPPTRGTAVVAFGDSLVSGKGASEGREFVSVLARRLNTRIVNAGRSGDTTGSALERLDRDVLALDPRIVIVLLGGNDFLRRVPRAETFRNLDAIVTRIRDHGAAVVVAGVSLGIFSDEYGEDYESLARRRSAGLVPDILGGIFGRAERMADAIHPNDLGHEIMADRLEPALRELLRDVPDPNFTSR